MSSILIILDFFCQLGVVSCGGVAIGGVVLREGLNLGDGEVVQIDLGESADEVSFLHVATSEVVERAEVLDSAAAVFEDGALHFVHDFFDVHFENVVCNFYSQVRRRGNNLVFI